MDAIMEKRLSEANDLREAEKYGEAAKLYTDCLLDLVTANDQAGLIHCLGGQSLIYKILSRQNQNQTYKNLTISFASEAYRIGVHNADKLDGRVLSIAYSSYGDALLMDGKVSESLPLFEKALSVSTADLPEKGRLKAHIGGIKYLLGEKELGKSLIGEALSEIRTGDLNAYAIRVWETGALNGLSKIYALEGQKEKALEIASESLKISIEHQLSIRKKEAEEILQKINANSTDFSI